MLIAAIARHNNTHNKMYNTYVRVPIHFPLDDRRIGRMNTPPFRFSVSIEEKKLKYKKKQRPLIVIRMEMIRRCQTKMAIENGV